MSIENSLLKVLLVEDNTEQLAFLQELLAASDAILHFRISIAQSLAEGLLRVSEEEIALILLDLSLPDSNGLETFISMAEAAPDAAIVVLSGLNDVALALETVQLGAQDYLVKGHVDNHLLFRSMQYAVERKRVQLQLKRAYGELEARVKERTGMLQQTNARLQKEIAERRRAEEETLESNRQLAAALGQLRATQQQTIERVRAEALRNLVDEVADEFHQVLTSILGFCDLLMEEPESRADPAKLKIYLQEIHRGAVEGADIVGRLRAVHLTENGEKSFQPTQINELVEQAISSTQSRRQEREREVGSEVEIFTDLADVPVVFGNPAQFQQAIERVLLHAFYTIPRRGTLTVRTEQNGPWLILSVTDDGIGLSEEVTKHCFDALFVPEEENGPGCGLSNAAAIVRRYGGEISIQSDEARGNSIVISLPLSNSTVESPLLLQEAAKITKSLRILVVDDEPLVREVIEVYLSEDDHHITTACNGREGLERFQEGCFDVVMTDRAMPEMNGAQLAMEIKKQNPKQPVILLTGFGESIGERPSGVDLIVSKPFTIKMLREAITNSLAGFSESQ